MMRKPALTVLAAAALAVLAGCSGKAASAHGSARSGGPPKVSVCGFLKSGGLVAVVNRPGVVTSGESVTLEASNPGQAVRLDIATLTVGGPEGVSGRVAGPDTITVRRTFTIPARTAELTALATFPVSDPGLENVPGPGVLEAVNDVSLASGC
jgi:hypothetical protein